MNKHLYRIIFNKARGMLVAVADIADAGHGHTARRQNRSDMPNVGRPCRPATLNFCLLMAAGGISFTARAGLEADPNAPGHQQPDITQTANGIPQIDIQTPNEHGVSHNTYRQFDVDPAGVILNNSRQPAQAQLSGYVVGNPWLAGGEASVILNEVNSPHASHLSGSIEVAGRSADVIIANPSGITCNGCGFINAHNATLAAGQVLMEDGRIKGYDVERGEILFEGNPSNLNTDHALLIARAVRVNARVQAEDLTVTTGRNVTDNHGVVTRKKQDDEAPSRYTLDVAALGGMYARKIHLVGNEQGLGVRNAGHIGASVGEITLGVNGRLENSGEISSHADLHITAVDDLHNPGRMSSQGNIHLRAAGELHSGGSVAARGNIVAEADSLHSGNGSTWQAGRDEQGNATHPGNLVLTATGAITLGGANLAGETLAAAGATLDLSGSQTSASQIKLNASAGETRLTGSILSTGQLEIHSPRWINNDGGKLAARQVSLTTAALSNQSGAIHQTDSRDLVLAIRPASDSLGSSAAGGALQNVVGHDGDRLDVNHPGIAGALDNSGGLIQTAGNIAVITGRLANADGTIQSAGNASVISRTFNNNKGKIFSDGNSAVAAEELDNRGGHIQAPGRVTVNAGMLNNAADGRIVAKGDVEIKAHSLNNAAGWIDTTGNLKMNAEALDNHTGKIHTSGNAEINSTERLDNTHGEIRAAGVTLSTGALYNYAGIIYSSGNVVINSTEQLDNSEGEIYAAGVTLASRTLINNAGKIQVSGNAMIHSTGRLDNTKGDIRTEGDLSLNTGALDNSNGNIFSLGDIYVINTNPALAGAFVNYGGQIQGNRHLGIDIGSSLDNRHGMLSSLNIFELKTAALDNRDGRISTVDKATLLIGERLDNGSGMISGGNTLTIDADEVMNNNTRRETLGISALNLRISARQLNNSSGAVKAGDQLDAILTQTLDNRQGLISAKKITLKDDVLGRRLEADNDGGEMVADEQGFYLLRHLAGGSFTFDTDCLINRDSQVSAGGALGGHTGDLRNEATPGERVTRDIGRQTRWYAKKQKKKGRGTKTSQGKDGRNYRPSLIQETIALKTAVWQANTRQDHDSPEIRSTRCLSGNVFNDDGTSFAERWSHIPFKAPIPPEGPEQLYYRPLDLSAGEFYQHPLPSVIKAGNAWTPVVRVMTPEVRMPASSLFTLHPGPAHRYLVETDPRYTQFKQWIGLDYMQEKIKFDPSLAHKRLGDGFYEQRLVRDQVLNLTGQRYLGGHTNDNEQFKALMNAGVQFGNAFNLTPGVMLSPSQMALLTTDMVWLVNRDVTLRDGSTQRVLVPQVYARVGKDDLSGDGALFSGQDVKLDARGDVDNSGSITARNQVKVAADNFTLSGQMAAKDIEVQAKGDITQTGGRLFGGDRLSLLAEQDIRIQSTVRGDQDNRWLDRPAGIYVQNQRGALELKALNNITLTAADIANRGENGRTEITAGNDMKLDTLSIAKTENASWGEDNYRRSSQRTDVGSRIGSGGALALSAGQDFSAIAAYIDAGQRLDLGAGRDVTLAVGTAATSVIEHMKQSSKGLLSAMSLETHDEVHSQQALGTLLSGEEIRLTAGRDLTVIGGDIAGTGDIALTAGNNLTLTTAQETRHESHFKLENSSGLMGSGGIGFTVGSESLKLTDDTDILQQKGTLAGSAEGSATLSAGGRLTVHGSELIAGDGIALSGADVDLTAAENSIIQNQTMEQQKSGFTLALSGTVGSAINSAVENTRKAEKTDNSRLTALQRTKAALSGAQAVQAGRIAAAQGDSPENNNTIGISLSYGSQSSRSEQRHEQRAAQGSALSAGGAIAVTATGRDGNGDITLQGGKLQAGSDISLKAQRDIHLLSALSHEKTEGSNSSKGGTVGVGIGFGQGGFGISVFASINKGKGSESGDGAFHTNALLDAGRQLRLKSGRDAILSGAQVNGETVNADIGRDLRLQSLQDSDNYDAKQQNVSAGGSFTFGSMTGSACVNISRDKIHSTYNAVREQTGIFAGKGGVDIRVGEHTQLDGAAIASTATADKNRLDTGTLGFSDIRNEAEFSAEHQSIGMSSGGPIGGQSAGNLANSLLAGGNHSDNSSSGTKAAFSPGSLIVRNQQEQKQDITVLSRDAEHAHETLSPVFDKARERERQQQAGLLADIGNQVVDIARSEALIGAYQSANEKMKHISPADRQAARNALAQGRNPNVAPTDDEINQYINGATVNQALADSGFAIGGGDLKLLTAASAVVQGLANGNLEQALAEMAAPYVAGEIKDRAGENDTARITAHTAAGAVLAHLQGNSALAGGAGALGAEVVAQGITDYLYPDIAPGQLTDKQKQKISAISTAIGGLAGGLTGKGGGDIVAGAQAGKNAVENNYLGAKQIPDWLQKYKEASTDEERNRLVDIASSVDNDQQQKALETRISKSYLTQQQDDLIRLVQSPGCDADCHTLAQFSINQLSPIIDNYDELQRSNNIPRAAIATVTLALPVLSKSAAPYVAEWVGGATAASRVIGMGTSGSANALMQGYKIYQDPDEDFSYASFGTSILTGGVAAGMYYRGIVSVNTAGAGFASWIDGKDLLAPMAGAAVGSTAGYLGGGAVLKHADKKLNPWSNGFKERFSLINPTISAPAQVNPWPSIWGSTAGSVGNEIAGNAAQEGVKELTK